jgi:hypothetical protein
MGKRVQYTIGKGNTIGKGFTIPWVGVRFSMGRGQNTIVREFNIP